MAHTKRYNWKSLKVLEVGSGTGIVGLVSAKLGAATTLTDLTSQVPLLRNNLELNKISNAQALPLHWGESVSNFQNEIPYDIIIAAECIYYIDVVPLLLKSLKELAGSETQILVSFERHNETASQLFETKAKEIFDIFPIPKTEQDPIYQSDKISLWILKLKR